MQSHPSRILSTLVECFLVACKRSRTITNDVDILQMNSDILSTTSATAAMKAEETKLRTWPVEELRLTVAEILVENKFEIDKSGLASLLIELENDINEKCPFQVEEHYDFCVICSFEDYNEAKKLANQFEEKYKLSGYLVWEAVLLGKDQFDAFEEVVDRSSKVLFYITDNFTSDEFCCHLARNTFVAPNEKTKQKIVPIIEKSSTKVPDSLLLVDKMAMDNPLHVELRFPIIFSESVKLEKHCRRNKIEVALDAERMKLLKEICKIKLNKM